MIDELVEAAVTVELARKHERVFESIRYESERTSVLGVDKGAGENENSKMMPAAASDEDSGREYDLMMQPADIAQLPGQSESLWNFSIGRGWTQVEKDLLKADVMKFGVGRWKALEESGVIRSKKLGRCYDMLRRLIGQ